MNDWKQLFKPHILERETVKLIAESIEIDVDKAYVTDFVMNRYAVLAE